ncbi:family 16 glycoside hydrolase [Brevifollis gellanilyticus]|nr:family 16 glycoside hydrolase [Brevifollis gellanilyticus]
MKPSNLLFSLLLASPGAFAADAQPLLAVPGKVIYESKLDTAPGAPWKTAKGKWELVEGVLRGSELAEDKHGAVTRLPNQLQDFVVEYEFKFEGGKSTSLSINAVKDHMARISITPKSIAIQRDDNDHEGPDKAVVFARFPAELVPGTWHKVRLEMVGDTLVGQVDDLIAWGSDPLFKTTKAAPGFTVAGQSVDFRNLTIREATLNPGWETAKAALPKPGEKVAPAPAAAKGKGKGKGKATAAKKKAE